MELPPANDRSKRSGHKNGSKQWYGMKLRLIETRLLASKRISWQWKNICDTKPTQLLREVLQYYKVGDQASVEVEGVEEQMLIFLSSLKPGRVKGFWIVLIWKIPVCLEFGKTSILTVL